MTEQETLRLDTLPVSEKKTTIDANADTLLIDDAEISQKVNGFDLLGITMMINPFI